ncbi:uncharacterized protein CLBA1 isoform X1 [Pyrgilauda ruficollis]|uniref:uncharacterized protein CLBA1 isoform X1 n=1 Tax=Pyrgilauda ruficollis TaxID=221976 RepID=UPI001B8637D2|nr:uncharacterized protein CLBA1 isoform X1 [Pyrgilauda ruficollis]XP_041332350.1 uncharacterized protein CLBA1 isoform X1 [Pyrgilauda ruficollis]
MQNLSVVESLGGTDIPHCELPKDLAAEAGGVSLHESGCNWNGRTSREEIVNLEAMQQSLPVTNSEGRSREEFSESSFSTSEPSGSWGDFEGFREPLDKPERFSDNLEVLVKSAGARGADPDLSVSAAHLSAEPSLCHGMQQAPGSRGEEDHSYEEIFKLGFPEVFVPQSRECITSLEQVLEAKNEDVWIPELLKNQLCMDSGNVWRALRDFDNTPSSRHPWSKSHCQENLWSVLGVDANHKDISENQADIFEESNVKDNEDFRFDGFSVNDCKALIQTKLSVSPDSRHGHFFNCNLFLKTTSSNENTQCITIPRKKQIFSTHNLKMKFFSSDVC